MAIPQNDFTLVSNKILDLAHELTGSEFKVLILLARSKQRLKFSEVKRLADMSSQGLFNTISVLVVKKLIKKVACDVSAEEAKRILCQKQPQTFPGASLTCCWCNSQTILLEEHHYPVPKRNKGAEIVLICGSCHSEFHHLTSSNTYELDEVLR